MKKEDKNTAIYTAFDGDAPFDFVVPEKNLLRAILTTAMNDLKKSGEVKDAATEYFLDVEDEYIFSFRSVCDFLSVDPDKVLIAAGLLQKENKSTAASSKKTNSERLIP